MTHDLLRPAASPVDLLRPREALASPAHAARAFEHALSRADARCDARPEPKDKACAPPPQSSRRGPDQARPTPFCPAAPKPRSACQDAVPSAPPAPSAHATAKPTPCGSAPRPPRRAETPCPETRPESKRAESLGAGRVRSKEPEASEAMDDSARDDTTELAQVAEPVPVAVIAPPAAAASAAVHTAAAPAFADTRPPSSDPASHVSAAAGGARRIRPLTAAVASPAQAGPKRAAAHPADPTASSTLAVHVPTAGFDARPAPVFEAASTAGQTTHAETAQHHARLGHGVAVGPSQPQVWQVELPMGPHADALQLTVSRSVEANATARADAVWALSLPAHRHARAALDALKVRLQRRGLSVGQVEDDAGSEPPEPLPR